MFRFDFDVFFFGTAIFHYLGYLRIRRTGAKAAGYITIFTRLGKSLESSHRRVPPIGICELYYLVRFNAASASNGRRIGFSSPRSALDWSSDSAVAPPGPGSLKDTPNARG